MDNEWDAGRRNFLHRSGIATAALLTRCVAVIYDHAIAELDHQQDLKPEWVTGAATLIPPRVVTDLVPVLKAHHDAGRQLTDPGDVAGEGPRRGGPLAAGNFTAELHSYVPAA